jgi:capsular polysaccharide transport system permease protein
VTTTGGAGASEKVQEQGKESKVSTSSGSTQISASAEDAHIVTSFIRSRAILDKLMQTIDIRAIYRRPEADFMTRLKEHATIEEIEDYWLDKVTTYVAPSGIVVVKIRAFRPDDALRIAREVNGLCALLVEEISRRARQDALGRAESEARRAEAAFRGTLADLESFRDREGLINPGRTGTSTETLINHLMSDRIESENDLFALRRLSPQSVRIAALTARIDAINARISELRARLTATDGAARTISASLSKFEELSIRGKLAEQMYTLARDGLARARETAERQWVFLSVFVPPSLPEESLFPERIAFSVLAYLGLLVIWSIGAVTWASILDHLL